MKANAATKNVKFRTAAERKVSRLLKSIHELADLANTKTYSYSPEQVREIFTALHEAIAAAENEFAPQESPEQTFTFKSQH